MARRVDVVVSNPQKLENGFTIENDMKI